MRFNSLEEEGDMYPAGLPDHSTKSMSAPLHSKLPPSKAAVWSRCTASVDYIKANAAILPKESSVYADRGTLVHLIATHYLGKGVFPAEALSKYPELEQVEMKACAKQFAEFVLGRMEPGAKLFVDRRVSLFYLPSQAGTLDAAVRLPGKLFIDDYKDGVGVGVYAKENEQTAVYAESLLRELEEIDTISDDELVVLSIFQPRDRNDHEPVRMWALSRRELREFVKPIEEASKIILDPARKAEQKFVAGPHCDKGFCPARGICKHYASMGLSAITDHPVEKIDHVELVPPQSLSRETRVKVILAKKTIEAWLEEVEKQEMNELLAGAPPQGLKLVEGKSNRQWKDEVEADKLLANYLSADERRKPWEVISPAQAEKALKGRDTSTKFDNLLQAAIVKPPGKPTIAPESDKRPALVLNVAEGLEKMPAEDTEGLI